MKALHLTIRQNSTGSVSSTNTLVNQSPTIQNLTKAPLEVLNIYYVSYNYKENNSLQNAIGIMLAKDTLALIGSKERLFSITKVFSLTYMQQNYLNFNIEPFNKNLPILQELRENFNEVIAKIELCTHSISKDEVIANLKEYVEDDIVVYPKKASS